MLRLKIIAASKRPQGVDWTKLYVLIVITIMQNTYRVTVN